jgi:hypothetical protein
MSGLMTQAHLQASRGIMAAIPLSLMIVVQNIMSIAWRSLMQEVKEGDFSICDSTEDQITGRLHMILGELDAAGDNVVLGWSQLQTPVREGNVTNYNGAHPDKQPDFAFRPIRHLISCGNTVTTAIFIECKPIDARHPIPSVYCRDGLVRFVNGDYAWGVDRAMMVGYVRNVCTLPGGLLTALADLALSREMELNGKLKTLPNTLFGDTVCQSSHKRKFQLTGIASPIDQIVVNHLWLHPADPCEQTRCRDILVLT